MRVMLVTTWGCSCGIATYSEELIEGARGLWEPFVVGPNEVGSGARSTVPVPFIRTWTRMGLDLPESLLNAVQELQPDIIHIQHEGGLFWSGTNFLRAVRACRQRCPVIVTLHTMKWLGGWDQSLWVRDLGHSCDAIVVHTIEALAAASAYASNVIHIPHGTAPLRQGDANKGMDAIRLPKNLRALFRENKPVTCLLYGFVGDGKNLVGTIRAIATAESRNVCPPNFILLVGEEKSQAHLPHLQGLVETTGLGPRTYFWNAFIPPQSVADVFALADYGVLNTTSWTLSASGAAHVYASHGVPLAVADRPIYQEAIRGGAIAFDLNIDAHIPTESCVGCIAGMSRSGSLRSEIRQAMQDWAIKTEWPNIAKKHLELYHFILSQREEKPRALDQP